MTPSEKEVLNVVEAAQFLGISERTLRQLIAEKRLPFARIGGSLRLRRTALVEWLQQQEQAARLGAIVGKDAYVPSSGEDPIRERRAEVEREAERMTAAPESGLRALIADKEALRRILEQQDRLTGFVPDPTATGPRAREMMLANGIRPEENLASRDIIQMREREEE
jgi:excisionase family DNA binding protein